MQEFSKFFKNLVVVLDNNRVSEILKVGYSVKLGRELLELYREEGRFSEGKSRSKGKRITIRFRGKPTIEGIYGLISLEVHKHALPILRKVEILINRDGLGTLTKGVNFYEVRYDKGSGRLYKHDFTRNNEHTIATFRRVEHPKQYLQLLPELWKAVDDKEF